MVEPKIPSNGAKLARETNEVKFTDLPLLGSWNLMGFATSLRVFLYSLMLAFIVKFGDVFLFCHLKID